MNTDRSNDPRAFRDFLDTKLSNGATTFTLDEALNLWEVENQSDQEREGTSRAIRQGLADVEAGRIRPFDEFDRDFRVKRGLPPRP